ncbi:hypothetical protein GCM10027422_08470 [Hymenobacter arcticus]
MNPTPDAPDRGAPNLRRAVATLPTHEPAPATWPRVAAQLAADEALARIIPDLPAHEPADDLWASIAARLDAPGVMQNIDSKAVVRQPADAVVRTLWPARPVVRRVLALAASVLLLLGVWWQQRPAAPGPRPVAVAAGPRESVAYSEETAAAPAPASAGSSAAADPLELQGQAFINSQCSALPGVCQSGEFRSLRTQLAELETQEVRLRLDARRFGTSPELLREQAQLVSMKAALTRELVQLFIS